MGDCSAWRADVHQIDVLGTVEGGHRQEGGAASRLGVTQDSVSRLEKRSDLLLSTLRKTVEALGGNLSLVAEFPDRAPVVLSGIAEDTPRPKPTRRSRVA